MGNQGIFLCPTSPAKVPAALIILLILSFLFVNVVQKPPEAVADVLKLQNFSGGACPPDPLIRYITASYNFPPLTKKILYKTLAGLVSQAGHKLIKNFNYKCLVFLHKLVYYHGCNILTNQSIPHKVTKSLTHLIVGV